MLRVFAGLLAWVALWDLFASAMPLWMAVGTSGLQDERAARFKTADLMVGLAFAIGGVAQLLLARRQFDTMQLLHARRDFATPAFDCSTPRTRALVLYGASFFVWDLVVSALRWGPIYVVHALMGLTGALAMNAPFAHFVGETSILEVSTIPAHIGSLVSAAVVARRANGDYFWDAETRAGAARVAAILHVAFVASFIVLRVLAFNYRACTYWGPLLAAAAKQPAWRGRACILLACIGTSIALNSYWFASAVLAALRSASYSGHAIT